MAGQPSRQSFLQQNQAALPTYREVLSDTTEQAQQEPTPTHAQEDPTKVLGFGGHAKGSGTQCSQLLSFEQVGFENGKEFSLPKVYESNHSKITLLNENKLFKDFMPILQPV